MAHIFISYSHVDIQFINDLVPFLQRKFRGCTIFYDEDISGGEAWWKRILKEIAACDLFIYLLSNDSLESTYCREEFREALHLQKSCLPIIVRRKTDIGGAPAELESKIRDLNHIDMSRGFKDREATAKLYKSIQQVPGFRNNSRLIAGIIGSVLILAGLFGVLPGMLSQRATPTPIGTQMTVLRTSTVPTSPATLVIHTPTTNMVASIDAVRTQSVVSVTATRWTATPTLTATLTDEQRAKLPVARNADWKPIIRDFDSVKMVLVPAGCFTMGTESGGDNDERPTAKICFATPFWIDQTEVTNAQFAAFKGQAGRSSHWPEANRPREKIAWFEARDFCAKRGARLPTEAEWEYAARGPDNLVYPWGITFVSGNVVYSGNSDNQTADVGSKAGGASWIGALEMSGNVWEWVSTIYRPYLYDPKDGRENNNDTDSARGLRGGSWYNLDFVVRSAGRNRAAPSAQDDDIGFRCARSG
jgi:formylglycine-generating enzyme required for sulfatase activity